MGDPSDLRFVPPSCASTPIDWTRVPEESKKFLLRYAKYDWKNEVHRPLPETIGDLAKMFDESKFFGYFGSALCTLLMDISEFGLQAAPEMQVGPRFYMKYLEAVWFVLFMPGKRDCISGYSDDIVDEDVEEDMDGDIDEDEDEDEDGGDEEDKDNDGNGDWDEAEKEIVAKEIVIAQEFDLKLTREVSQGAASIVDITKKLGGWEASMLHEDLEAAQYSEAIMKLPRSHPAFQGLMENVMSSIRR